MSATWTLVLAGGDGTRLAPVTRRGDGAVVPKQFCRLTGPRSLLEQTLDRADRISGRDRTVCVVTSKHSRWWSEQLGDRALDNVVVQEANRGTAAGVLLPIAHILRRDPDATIVILPSDHHFADEDTFVRAIRRGVEASRAQPQRILLMGIVPERPETDYGWILPATDHDGAPARVACFVEKPPRHRAQELMSAGGLWSPFVLIGKASAFRDIFARSAPDLLQRVEARVAEERQGILYRNADLPELDFSGSILQAAADRLRVMPVPACGWSDVGTPERLRACQQELPRERQRSARVVVETGTRAQV
ncbi:MAG: NTP transferase domain-containing protein [Deltaproteobacteria bacterium]|nr:NTP transferase domain-containing protein [Deltaproteobacteria bacterium]